jgi:hypothetical protein
LTFVALAFFTWSCNSPTGQKNSTSEHGPIDTLNAIKILNFWVTPKKSFKFNSVGQSGSDTISFVTCSEYVYSPFGQLHRKSDLEKSLLKDFNVKSKTDTMIDGLNEFHILTRGQNRLIIYFDLDPSCKHSYIEKGDILKNNVILEENVQIGLGKIEFLNKFFDDFPQGLANHFSVVVFESCVEDIRHTYTFKEDTLKFVNFSTYSYWTVNY